MMRYLIVLVLLWVMANCGGAAGSGSNEPGNDGEGLEEIRYTAEDMVPRAVLTRAELTTAVDAKRYRAAAPIKTEFGLSDKVIYFVGRLKRVPTDATIEVRWFLDRDPEPMLISDIQGSDSFQFISSFSPRNDVFVQGSYTARVFVDEREVGGTPFVIGNPDTNLGNGPTVTNIAFSKAVKGSMKPRRPRNKFGPGTHKLYVSFNISGVEPDMVADVYWFRGEESFHNADIRLDGNRRYASHVASPGGLPNGEYRVDIAISGDVLASKSVIIGKKSAGAAIDDIAFGVTLNDSNMPKRRKTIFKRNTKVIHCGIRFVDLNPASIIELQWFAVDDDGESQVYTNRSTLSNGGSGTMGAAWEPNYDLSKGEYKVVVLVNDMTMNEASFRIE